MTGSRWPLSSDAFHLASALLLGLRLEKRGRRWVLLPEKGDHPPVDWQRVALVQELSDAEYIRCESSRATLTHKGRRAVRYEEAALNELWKLSGLKFQLGSENTSTRSAATLRKREQ